MCHNYLPCFVISTVVKTIMVWDYDRIGDVAGSGLGIFVGSHDKYLILRWRSYAL